MLDNVRRPRLLWLLAGIASIATLATAACGGAAITSTPAPTATPPASSLESVGPHLFLLDGENAFNAVFQNWGEPPRIGLRFANGTQDAPEGIKKDDLFGWIVWQALDGTDGQYHTLGNIEMRADEDPSGANAIPGALSFWTVNGPDAAGYPYSNAEKLRILSDGTIVVGAGDGERNFLGERGTVQVAGGSIRAPDLAPGVADVPGASLTLSAGLGTGEGKPGRIIFQVPRKVLPGEELQRRYSILVLDEYRVIFNAPIEVEGVRLTGEQLRKLLALIE